MAFLRRRCIVVLVSICAVSVVACAEGVVTPSTDEAELATQPPTTIPRDAARADVDNSVGDDAATPNGDDASTVADGASTDSGGGKDAALTGTSYCASPIDVSAAGTFTLDTCTSSDLLNATCGSPGRAVIVRATMGGTWFLNVPPGWVIQQLQPPCTPQSFACSSTGSWGVSGLAPGAFWYFAVQATNGSCGSVAVTVTKS